MTFQPATASLIRRSPAAPPVGTPRGRANPPVPATGAAGALPGMLTPANLAAFGAAATGTTQLSRRYAAAAGATAGARPPTVGPQTTHDTTVRRFFDVPSPSELFERARSWFAGTEDSPTTDPNGTNNGGTQSGHPSSQLPGIQADTPDAPAHSTELAERPRSLSALLRQGSSMTEPIANQQDQSVGDSLSPREWDQLVDLVVERIEERVRDELARRGRRFSPGVF